MGKKPKPSLFPSRSSKLAEVYGFVAVCMLKLFKMKFAFIQVNVSVDVLYKLMTRYRGLGFVSFII